MAAPSLAVEIGRGERVLIAAFVVVVIGSVGSVRGALVGALLVRTVDSLTRAFQPQVLNSIFSATVADSLAADLASISVYVLLAVVRIVRPFGLFSMKS
ncbi:UNVERIFIED_ORG: branched-subunit amino acid ABC-type transport system permease component [Paraburkholderia sediminicola]|nr:branched-subunit amino acid ABC-type transport system permease component [Paraburkholderia sediminicola]